MKRYHSDTAWLDKPEVIAGFGEALIVKVKPFEGPLEIWGGSVEDIAQAQEWSRLYLQTTPLRTVAVQPDAGARP